MKSRPAFLLPAVVLALIVINVFGPVLRADFVLWDDDINIYKNPHLGGLDSARLVWMFTDFTYSRVYNPVAWLTWSAVYECFGLDPFGFHLLNLILHTTNAVLVFLVFRKGLRLFASSEGAVAPDWSITWAGGIAALIWALHPLQVEPVAWATAIGYVQGLFFLLLSLLSYLTALEQDRRGWRLVALAFFLASLLTYPIALGAPVVFLALDWLVQRRDWRVNRSPPAGARWSRLCYRNSGFVLASLAVFAITLYAREVTPSYWKPPPSLEEFGIPERAAQAFYGWAYYLWRPLWPDALAPYYTTLLEVKPFAPAFIVAMVLVVGATVGVFLARRHCPHLAAGWICYLCLLLPLLGIFEHPHFTNDRYFYVVSVVLAAAVATVLNTWFTRRLSSFSFRRPGDFVRPAAFRPQAAAVLAGVALVCGIAVSMGVASRRQIAVWRNSETLFSHLITTLGDHSSRANFWVRLGGYHGERGEYAAAERALRSAIAILPDAPVPQWHLGRVLAAQGRFEAAAEVFSGILKLHPGFELARTDLARVQQEHLRSENAMSGVEHSRGAETPAERDVVTR